eukprot:1396063-Prymnesium_polylepis.1
MLLARSLPFRHLLEVASRAKAIGAGRAPQRQRPTGRLVHHLARLLAPRGHIPSLGLGLYSQLLRRCDAGWAPLQRVAVRARH